MYLSKLEIFGFKSFANKTTVNLTKGITGIVGPNGCGKTNIVDALRWCLGEQKSSTLRSDKMENVIFNGTRAKKPMGMAEVSLTLVNDRGVLPTEYSEVTITRRIFRSGESEYLLNKNICRLKDITNLFMDTGMGTNAYSVIELKMIETILSSKADERRKMFEEAAGVNKYKLRRRLALKKLEDVKADLTRVNDIVSEVEKNVHSLERQAKKADRYNQIQSVLRDKELDLAEREWSLFHRTKSQNEEIKNAANERKQTVDTEIRRIENELIKFRTAIDEVESRLSQKRYEIKKQNDKINEIQRTISVAEERLNSFESNLIRYRKELEDYKEQREEMILQIDLNNDKIVELGSDIESKKLELENSKNIIAERSQKVEERKTVLAEKREQTLTRFRDLTQKENQLNNLQNSRKSVDKSINKLNEKIQNITNNIAKTVGYLEDLQNEKEQAEKKLKDSEKLFAEKQAEKERLEKELNNLRSAEVEEKSAIKNLKDKIDFLHTLITNLEGVSQGSKILLESEGWTDKEKYLFADVGSAEEDYKYALEAALKPVLNNVLVETMNDLEQAVAYLKKNDLGKASFYLLQDSGQQNNGVVQKLRKFNANRKRKKLQKEEAFIDWAANFIKCDDKWKPYFDKVLFGHAVVKDLKSAEEFARKYPEFNYTTLEGDLVQAGGVVYAGSLPKLDDSIFGRKQMLDDLKAEYPQYEDNLHKLQLAIEAKEKEIGTINLKNISDRAKILMNDISTLEKQIAQFEFEKNKASEDVEKSQSEIHELATRSNQLDTQIEELSTLIDKEKDDKDIADLELKELETESAELDREYKAAQDIQNNLRIELERLLGQKQNAENALERAEQNKVSIENGITKRESDIDEASEGVTLIKDEILIQTEFFDELKVVRQGLIEEERGIESELRGVKSEASEFEQTLNGYRSERQEISDSIHSADVKISEINVRMENLLNDIQEDYAIEIEFKEFEDIDTFDFKERRSEVLDLKGKIKNLGPINLLAYSEYEEERDRLDFLHKQRDDLNDSEKDLINSIKEINQTAQDLFQSVFQEIRQSFQRIFRSLFDPGDEADLLLEEGVDPLEAKIEIIAKPKGKRPTGIELLSGGEKTLTATALLFAIYLVKPSPFCILDEVDAPLDDANVDRFTKLIKEFSINTQFIIVTHNKRTMEAAENMYGVTIQEEGISKLVGVQFKEDLPVT